MQNGSAKIRSKKEYPFLAENKSEIKSIVLSKESDFQKANDIQANIHKRQCSKLKTKLGEKKKIQNPSGDSLDQKIPTYKSIPLKGLMKKKIRFVEKIMDQM